MSALRQTHSPIRTPRTSAVSPRRGNSSGAIPLAPQVSKFRRTATRMTVSIGVAVLVVMTSVLPVASASSSDVAPPDKTALIMGASTIPTPDEFWVDSVMNQFIAPTHPDQTIKPVAVTTPEEGWPLTGILRLLFSAFGPPEIWGPVAQRGRMSRGGNSRGCSTALSISRYGSGWLIWRRRWPHTATTIW
jgi:hypothetical protein